MHHQMVSLPVSLVCVAAPADVALLVQWEMHLLPLQQARLLTFWSARQIQAGSERLEQIHAHMDQATCLVLLLSADFFADEECLALMQHALLHQQNTTTVVVPLILRPVAWQDSELGSLPCLPADGNPVIGWSDRDTAFHTCLQDLRSLLHLPAYPGRALRQGRTWPDKNRERMVRRLRRSYKELLSLSLQNMAWLELGFTERSDAVQNVTNLALRIAQQPEQALPGGTTITQAYEAAEQELLILGEPGAGKSTELLLLAHQLVTQAEREDTALLPVIFSLSSWAIHKGTLDAWMIGQITHTYGIPFKVSQRWVEQEQILPLLDGLDEMDEMARPDCIQAINTYHLAHLTPLVVCSRTEEYESAANKQRLLLQNAVVIRPLTHEQIETALDQAGATGAALRTELQEQPALAELVTSPLMFSVLLLTYQGKTGHTHFSHKADLEHRIWTDYVTRMIERKGNAKRYPLERTVTWLAWLARQMQDHNLTIFLPLHPYYTFLPSKYASLSLRSTHLFYGLLGALLGGLDLGLFGALFGGLRFGLPGALLSGLGFGLPGVLLGVSFGASVSRDYTSDAEMLPVPLGAVLGGLFGILFGVQFGGFVDGTPGAVLGVLLGILLGVPLGALLVAGSVYFLVLRLAEKLGGGVEPYLFRFWLWRTHLFPRRATTFLDDATARILLRRVGGGYSFIHRLLLDYFAALEMAPPSTSSDAHPVEP